MDKTLLPLRDAVIVDDDRDIITIYGVRYAGALFRGLAVFMPLGQLFRLEQREDGLVTIRQINPENT